MCICTPNIRTPFCHKCPSAMGGRFEQEKQNVQRELGTVDDGMMCVWRDNTEISHYLMAHINDKENMEVWQAELCAVGAETIDRLRAEVRKLRATIEREAEYCYGWAASAEMMGDDDRAKRHRERGDRLRSSI